MKLAGVLTTVLLLGLPLAAAAQGHGGAARVAVAAHGGPGMGHGMGHAGGFHGPGPGHGFGFRDRFHDRFHDGLLVGGWPYWGWSGCGLNVDDCDWDSQGDDPGAPPAGYADASMTGPPCGGWVSRAGGYAWAPDACRDPPAAADPPHAAIASNECSDWVWRASLHHSVCRRPSRTSG